jgi:hypothetical protein
LNSIARPAIFAAYLPEELALKAYMTILHCLANEVYLELLG